MVFCSLGVWQDVALLAAAIALNPRCYDSTITEVIECLQKLQLQSADDHWRRC